MDSIFPGLSGVSIKLPSVSFLSSSPVWDSETLEDGSWSSVESDISYTLQKSIWVEVLGIYVVLNVWLLVEFVNIEVFNSNTYIILN